MADTADEIRYAIERAEYERAQVLWEQWSAELAGHLAAGTLDPAEWARAGELFRWSRSLLLAERAHLQVRLNTLHAAGAYGPHYAPGAATLIQGRF